MSIQPNITVASYTHCEPLHLGDSEVMDGRGID